MTRQSGSGETTPGSGGGGQNEVVVKRKMNLIEAEVGQQHTSKALAKSRFLQIRLGSESCDQISASPNRPKRAKSRDRPQEVYLLVPTLWLNSVKLKGISSRFYNKTYKDKLYMNIIIVYTTQFIFC